MLVKAQDLALDKKNVLVEQLNESTDYALLVAEISKHHEVKEIKATDIFELTFAPKSFEGEAEVKTEAIFVTLNDEVIVQALKTGDELAVKAHFSVAKDGGKVIQKAIVDGNEVVIENEIPFEASYFLFIEELKNPVGADQVEEEGKVTTEAWYEGCLIFFNSGNGKYYYYKYCGAKCSSGTPINALDRCCQAHDRCWANFGHGDNTCDKQLYYCANGTSDPGWWMVAEYGLLASQGRIPGS
ncbi:hypothetical protein P4679_30835 [Priestia megaterium]|uniref:hypothetical protein n=1 Tax=Priestia megaterium TaxID=1404 RepID=UPI002E1D62DC|nr:hypothetical protein [Priestia megaterium]